METVVDLEVPETPEVLVLNGVLDTDTNVRVFVSHSIGAFSNQTPISINNANVKLFQDDILLENLSVNLDNTMFYYFFNSGLYDSIPINYYEGNLVPEKSTNYRVEVSHDNYPTISASTYIPDDINVYNIDVDTLSNEDKIGFNFSFIDKPNVANYYRLKLFSSCSKEWEKDGEIETYTFNGYVEMMSNDPSFPSTGLPWSGYSFEGNKVIFSDALFNGEEKNIRLDIDTDGFRYQNCDTIRLQFSVFSADTYSYYNSLNDHREEGLLNIFGGEVVPVYSNVQNGLGALISTNAQIIQIKP
tara:strand:+ start:4268 stop:5170 length:903 start_codon:yes stop_codon:yes gene_type:complete